MLGSLAAGESACQRPENAPKKSLPGLKMKFERRSEESGKAESFRSCSRGFLLKRYRQSIPQSQTRERGRCSRGGVGGAHQR